MSRAKAKIAVLHDMQSRRHAESIFRFYIDEKRLRYDKEGIVRNLRMERNINAI